MHFFASSVTVFWLERACRLQKHEVPNGKLVVAVSTLDSVKNDNVILQKNYAFVYTVTPKAI